MAITWTAFENPTGVNASKTGTSYTQLIIKTNDSTAAYYEVKGIQSIPALGSSVSTLDVTCLADDTKRNIKGIRDAGSGLTIKLLHSKANFTQLKAAEEDGNTFDFQIWFNDGTAGATGTVAQFTAYPAIGVDDVSVDGAITDSLTLVVTAPSSGTKVIDFGATKWTLTTT